MPRSSPNHQTVLARVGHGGRLVETESTDQMDIVMLLSMTLASPVIATARVNTLAVASDRHARPEFAGPNPDDRRL